MNITLFGGAFNPPHLGHLIVIQQAFELIPNLDELWILPCYRHTFQKNLAPVKHRLKMSQLLISKINQLFPFVRAEKSEGSQFSQAAMASQAQPDWQANQVKKPDKFTPSAAKKIAATRARRIQVKLETIEIDNKLSGETYEALQLLKKTYPNHKFTFLMGTDQLTSFKKWGNWEKLLSKMPFYIYPRAGYKNSLPFPNMTLLTSPTQVVTNISSTLVRNRIKQSLPISHLIPESVLKYLRIQHLY